MSINDLSENKFIKEFTEEKKKRLNKRLEDLNMTFEEYIESLVDSDINRLHKLGNDIKYDDVSKILYRNDEVIKLSDIELQLFELLHSKKGKNVSIDEILDSIWGKKNPNRFVLRNKIKILRDKTFYELIKNNSNRGYEMNA